MYYLFTTDRYLPRPSIGHDDDMITSLAAVMVNAVELCYAVLDLLDGGASWRWRTD